MSGHGADIIFAGSIPELYESYLPEGVSIVSTDLNQPMLDHAAAVGTKRPVEWRQADAMKLPFTDGAFDAVVCQFGAMFFPDRARAFSEARRVLSAGGVFIFNVWDRIEENEFADTITTALESEFPRDPPRFLARTPHGYFYRADIERDLRSGGFTRPSAVGPWTARSRRISSAWETDPAAEEREGSFARPSRSRPRLSESTSDDPPSLQKAAHVDVQICSRFPEVSPGADRAGPWQ